MLKSIIQFLSSGVLKVIGYVSIAVAYVFKYFITVKKEEIASKDENKRIEENKKIDEVCDKGSIDDLINLGVK